MPNLLFEQMRNERLSSFAHYVRVCTSSRIRALRRKDGARGSSFCTLSLSPLRGARTFSRREFVIGSPDPLAGRR